MGEETTNPDSILTLPVVLGVIVVLGGMAALAVSGLFVYRAHTVNVETQRIQASLQAERERGELASRSELPVEAQESDSAAPESLAPPELDPVDMLETDTTSITVTSLKPGARLEAQRPAHWDQAEIIDVLEDHKVKVRWLSGEPGEAVIAADLVRVDFAP